MPMTTMKRKTGIKTLTLPTGSYLKLRLAAAATAIALLGIPHLGHAQGIVGGAREGSRYDARPRID